MEICRLIKNPLCEELVQVTGGFELPRYVSYQPGGDVYADITVEMTEFTKNN